MNKQEVYRYVLENAVKYNGEANLNAVVSHLLTINPEFKNNLKEYMKEVKIIVDDVNSWDLEKQKIEYGKLGKVEKRIIKKKVEKKLKNVVVRFAPNPNGAMTLGHCRPAILNYEFSKKHKGKFILRFDDTDPKVKPPMKEAYSWFKEDLKYLGIKLDKTIIQSSRLEIYYKYAEKLIKKNKAYVCSCNAEAKRNSLKDKKTCPCWSLSIKETFDRWKDMFNKYKQGGAVLRIKTDHKHKNPAIRDWAAFRIIDESEHPLNKKAKVWPLLNFASAIDDHDLKVSHIIRGIDLAISDERQKYVYDYFKWNYPETMYHGKLKIKGIKSTSMAKELIEEKKLTGWDDVKLGTVKSLRRRGITGKAIYNFIKDIGLTRQESNVSFDKLVAFNKDEIENNTRRFYVVFEPRILTIKNAPKISTKIPHHKDNKRLGYRLVKTSNKFYIQDKIGNYSYRLIHLFNFKRNLFISKEYDPRLDAKLIHWLPYEKNLVNVDILMDDGLIKRGIGERSLKNVKIGEMVQFERNFFCKLERKSKDKLMFIYSHR